MTNDQKLIVAGLGRCGSSLLMQLLDAGGFPCNGTFPSYEDAKCTENFDLSLAIPGQANKLLDLQRSKAPEGNYRWIWLNRDHKQQGLSMIKLLNSMDAGVFFTGGRKMGRSGRNEWRLFAKSLKADTAVCMRKLEKLGGPRLTIRFEDLILKSRETIEKVSQFVGGIDTDKAFKAIIPRQPDCYPTLLEEQLIYPYQIKS